MNNLKDLVEDATGKVADGLQPKKVGIDKKVTARAALPFLKWAPWLLVLATVGFILEPTVRSAGYLWPVIVVMGGISGFMVYMKKTGKTFAQVSESLPFIGKILNAAVIISVLGSILLLIRWAVNIYMVEGMGISVRYSYMMVIGASPFVLSGVWSIFKESLPGKPIAVFFGSLLIALALIATLIFVDIQSPEGFVDHKTGEPIKWYSPAEDRLYSSPGVDGLGNKLIPAVEAFKSPDKKTFSALTRKTGDDKHMWKFNVISKNHKNYGGKVLQENYSTALVTRTATQLVIRCFKRLTEVAVLEGASTDGKIYTGTWADHKALQGANSGTFEIEFEVDGAALGTMNKQDGSVLTIDLRRWSVK